LTAINLNGTNTKTGTVTVNPEAVVKPVASFTVSPTSGGTTATNYTFTDNSTNSPTNWFWNFGDGGTASGKSVTHKYTTAKTYNVTLTAGNTAGNSTATKTVTVSAGTATKSPVPSFIYSPTTVKKGATIQFTDKSTNTPNKWKWTFGDGSAAVTSQNPKHVFSKTGSFKVSMAAYNNIGSNTATNTITVS
jgi:tripartite motif-containing protein 71